MVDPRARVLLDPTQRGDSHTILSDSATTTDPLKVPSIQRAQSDPASTVQRARSSERASSLSVRTYTRLRPSLQRSRFSSAEAPSRSRSASFSPSPAPSQLPPLLPEHAGNFQKEAFSRQIGDARTAAVVVFFPRRVKSTAATPFVRGIGERGPPAFPRRRPGLWQPLLRWKHGGVVVVVGG